MEAKVVVLFTILSLSVPFLSQARFKAPRNISNVEYNSVGNVDWHNLCTKLDLFTNCFRYYLPSNYSYSKAYWSMNDGFYPVRALMGKWTKRGYVSLVIVGYVPPQDLTIYLDIAKNPGPSLLVSRNLSRQSFKRTEAINLHLTDQQHHQDWTGEQSGFNLPPNDHAINWQDSGRAISTRITTFRIRKPKTRSGNIENCIRVDIDSKRPTNKQSHSQIKSMEHGGQSRQISIAHLNVQSLRNKTHYTEIKKLASEKDYDILLFLKRGLTQQLQMQV